MRDRARRTWVVAALFGFLVSASSDIKSDHVAPASAASDQAVAIDPRRSLVVTEQPILTRFGYQRVLEQVVATSGVPGLTALALHQQWWSTQNPGPGPGPHCDDYLDELGNTVLNAFPYTCRPAPSEGAQAAVDPFADAENNPDSYIPIGLFNRFDLAPSDGGHCGEYRVVFAKRSGIVNAAQRNLVIFESLLPNRQPHKGLKGCKEIVQFWAGLSREDDLERRADLLERFYFVGLNGNDPVIHADHLGAGPAATGQIRSNQFVNAPSFAWSLREFKLVKQCDAKRCTALAVVPATNKINPFGPLFAAASNHSAAAAFREFFPSQVPALTAGDLNAIDMDVPDVFNTGQSQASGGNESRYLLQFGVEASPLRQAIQEILISIGSALTPDEVVLRAQALSCAGCHRLNNGVAMGGGLVWPPSLGFTHVSEQATEVVGGVTRFVISPALVNVFLPRRQQILEEYVTKEEKKKSFDTHRPH
jgi:hypothetical protein